MKTLRLAIAILAIFGLASTTEAFFRGTCIRPFERRRDPADPPVRLNPTLGLRYQRAGPIYIQEQPQKISRFIEPPIPSESELDRKLPEASSSTPVEYPSVEYPQSPKTSPRNQ